MIQSLCYFGVIRGLWNMNIFKQLQEICQRLPKQIRYSYQSILFLDKTAKTVASEFSHLELGYKAIRGSTLGNIPLVVIKSGVIENLGGFSESEVREVEAAMNDVAVEMSQLSPLGELWVAENIGHNIHIEDPDLVVKAVKKVCEHKYSACSSIF